MSVAYGPPIISGAFNYGPGSFGVLGSAVASDGIDGPGYPYNSLSLPGDASKEYCAWITTPPTQGVLKINPLDFSFTWTGLPQGTHSFGFTLVEDGVELVPERFVYADVDVAREVAGGIMLDEVAVGGAMFVADIAVYGTVTTDAVDATGQLACINPCVLEGSAVLDDGVATGSLGMQLDDRPLTDAEMRQLYNWLRDLHTIHGLSVGAPLTVGQSARVAGHVTQTITDVGGATVVTRG